MKNLIALVLSVCVLLSFSLVYAEVGFGNMTDDELLLAQEELQNELLSRGLIKKTTMPPGVYEVGVDIPAGKYIFTAATVNPSMLPAISLYKNKTDTSSIVWQILEDYGSYMVTLEEGQILKLDSVSFTLEKYFLPSF